MAERLGFSSHVNKGFESERPTSPEAGRLLLYFEDHSRAVRRLLQHLNVARRAHLLEYVRPHGHAALAEGGFAYVMSTVPIRTVGEMRRQKVWIPANDSMILETVKAFNITPVPLSIADVRTGLQTGLINTVTTPPIGAFALQWHTQIKYLLDEPFLYIFGVLAVDRKAFLKMSPGDQKIFREIMGRVFEDLDRRNREDNIKALETLRKQGIEFVKPSGEALEKWFQDASEVPKRLVETDRLSQEMVDTMEGLLRDYRTKELKTDE